MSDPPPEPSKTIPNTLNKGRQTDRQTDRERERERDLSDNYQTTTRQLSESYYAQTLILVKLTVVNLTQQTLLEMVFARV